MNIEQLENGLWVPSTDAQIEQWRQEGQPHMQDKCLFQFVKWCESQNKSFGTVADVGSWCGTWAIAMQGFAKEMHCFEPNHVHYECLTRNIAKHKHIITYNQAIGSEDGFVKLSDETATQNTRVLLEKGETKINKLDTLDIGKIDLLKIDVEGLEMEVLKGASEKLKDTEYLMIELNNNSKKYGSSNGIIEKHLESIGFKELIKTWPDIVYSKA